MKQHLYFFAALICSLFSANHTHASEPCGFVVAGHTYGSHYGSNLALDPRFKDSILNYQKCVDFIVLAGDFVRNGTQDAIVALTAEIKQINKKTYLVMGNHDYTSEMAFKFNQDYGGTFYSFKHGKALHLVIDGYIPRGRIEGEQLNWLKDEIENFQGLNIFLYLHELIWTQGREWDDYVKHNYRDYTRVFETNFWAEVAPFLLSQEKKFFFVAGDVGGNGADTIPYYFDTHKNLTFLATGMGEVALNNFLHVTYGSGDMPEFKIINISNNQIHETPF